ncbi:hypothetical protein BGZ73_002456 [Actinomortierella ambigua]|nr:hypothetical protein BGZ73_002456 [Actinomortierella ambigua]
MHDVFHVEKLRRYEPRDPALFPTAAEALPDVAPVDDEPGVYYKRRYEVEKILEHGFTDDDKVVYRVKWKNYPDNKSTWQSPQDLSKAPLIHKAYQDSLKSKDKTDHDIALQNSFKAKSPAAPKAPAKELPIRKSPRTRGVRG